MGLLKTTKGIILVDPIPGSEHLDALNTAVKNLIGEPVSFILSTHEHSDHSGGNTYFSDMGGILLDDAANFTEIYRLLFKSHPDEYKVFLTQKVTVFLLVMFTIPIGIQHSMLEECPELTIQLKQF
ncbi:MBL fold metallo-hydrolase [Microbulbifer taiwanensis]|uniref:MBL fold metallo-hydrolase n=1 Tax=Microbulbifer taiwanensis TaxID=986746 RepID=A0ABW1YQ27_9GAMM